MKNITLFLLLWAACCLGSAKAAGQSPRKTINLNREWKYARGDHQGAEQPGFEDRQWETTGIPHSFSIPYFMSQDFYVGYGWYRKTVRLTAKELSKRLFLEFDGVFQEAEVFVNGRKLKTHTGGYTGFSVCLSPAVREGDNLIAVRVNNRWQPDVAPRAGEHVKVEASMDKQHWCTLADRMGNEPPTAKLFIRPETGKVKARFVRISFPETDSPTPQPALGEVIVRGFVLE